MIGHPFGFKSAVYNYNRRSLLLNTILRNVFKCLSGFYYDDKFGFELASCSISSFFAAIMVHYWVGAVFNVKKLDLAPVLEILGIAYNLPMRSLMYPIRIR